MRSSWNFDIDRYLNHIVPPPPWRHLPYPVAWFLGHRRDKPQDIGNLMPIFWAFIGAFCSIAVIEAVSMHVASFQARDAPVIVGSFGAAAVLEFYAIEAPLAQPRNVILGQVFASIIGVGVCKLFQLSDNFENLQWLGGALACAAATAFMAITKTVHPPAGATALLAVTNPEIVHLGWFLVPVMLLGCTLMLGVALVINNIDRRFPIYWWTPEPLDRLRDRQIFRRIRTRGEEQEIIGMDLTGTKPVAKASDVEAVAATSAAGREAKRKDNLPLDEIVIRPGTVIVPENMYLAPEEQQYLETLSQRL